MSEPRMVGVRLSQLPADWQSELIARTINNCWIWLGEYKHYTWDVARALIADKYHADDVACWVTPACVNPLHGPDTRPRSGTRP